MADESTRENFRDRVSDLLQAQISLMNTVLPVIFLKICNIKADRTEVS